MLNFVLIAVSSCKAGPEKTLYDHYVKRLHRPLHVIEVKAVSADALKEGEDILKHIHPSSDWVCALDERGDNIPSRQLASLLDEASLSFKRHIFVIGGADGLHERVRQRANYVLSFGKLTWPHLMVRSMLAEQLYRCQQIALKHPYHRESSNRGTS